MTKKKDSQILRFWDSDCFLGWLNNEPDKAKLCGDMLQIAEEGNLKIVCSSLALVEVIKMKKREKIPKENAEIIRNFFQRSYIYVRNLDRFDAEYARELIWEYESLNPKDAVHIATALKTPNIKVMNTFDEGLLKLDGNFPDLKICKPDLLLPEGLFSNDG